MPLTKDFKETIQARARRDSAFREALLKGSHRLASLRRYGNR